MMTLKEFIKKFKHWYDCRPLREQLLTLGLSIAIIYAIFSLILFNSLDKKNHDITTQLKTNNDQIANWKTQISVLDKISTSPLYQKWLNHHAYFKNLQEQYKYLLKNSSNKQWQDVITTILRSQPNITLIEITNSPEEAYSPSNVAGILNKIYQQKITLTIQSDFYDTLSYLQQLEKLLPNIYWDSLDYQVTKYPMAKVEMEFSIIYEKTT